MDLNVRSEINPLRLVITHRPGNEHEYITPSNLIEKKGEKDNPDYLLFDDLIYVPKAKEEHQSLYDILHYFTDGNCYELTDLLKVVLNNKSVKEMLINDCIKLEEELYNNTIEKDQLTRLDNDLLVDTLLSGYNKEKQFFTYPIPNLIFTRDIAVCIGNTVLITWSTKHVRRRENIIAKHVLENHNSFKSLNVFDFHEHFPNLTIEGGDILVFDNKRICIGISERTPLKSVSKLAPLIFKEGFETIIGVDLPKKRALMHLDTIFTRISEDEVLIFPPILDKNFGEHLNKTYIYKKGNENPNIKMQNLISILKDDGLNMNYIKCGSDSKIMQEREQWTDGANAFTLSPGKIIGYDCNTHTLEELKKAGYQVISTTEYIDKYKYYNESENKFIITIQGSELLRGRGGPRCLTLPLFRV